MTAALPYESPREPLMPPIVPPSGRFGLRSSLHRLWQLMFDPVGLIRRLQAEHGDVFTMPVPFDLTPPFTFVTTRRAYNQVLRLAPDIGRNGPVIDRVPALARWVPRSSDSNDHLQALLLIGRRIMADQVRRRGADGLAEEVRQRVTERIRSWPDTVDLTEALTSLVHDVSARMLLGNALWEELGPHAPRWVRTIVNAVDAARAASALTPGALLLPERRACKALGCRLLTIAKDESSRNRHPLVRALQDAGGDTPLPPEDVAWLMFFTIWNATLYTGTYGTWSMLDLLDHPQAMMAVRSSSPKRRSLMTGAILETMRLHPISWQLRSLSKSIQMEVGEELYELPAGHFVSVFSYALNRDESVYVEPDTYRPQRYLEGAPQPLLFGAGPFSCVAQHWVKTLMAVMNETIVDEVELERLDPIPERRCRVHLLYPSRPIRARVRHVR